MLSLQAENDELRLQEIEDRRRITQLIEFDPLVAAKSGAAQPQASYDGLMLKIESLSAQLNEQKQLGNERVAALLEDRRIREQEEATHRALMNQQLDAASQKLKKTEELLRIATKDAILARRDKQQAEERALLVADELAVEKRQHQEEMSATRRRALEEVRELKEHGESKLDDIASNLRRQLKLREEELASIGSVHTATRAQLEKRVSDLELKNQKLVDQNRALELRRHQDLEGWTADVTNLRKLLVAVDKKLHEMRLVERLGEDDRLDTILAHIRQKTPQVDPDAIKGLASGGLPGSRDAQKAQGGSRRPQSATIKMGSKAAGGSGGAQGGGEGGSEASSFSVKGELAKGLGDVKSKIKQLEEKLAAKKKAVAAQSQPKGDK